MLCVRRFAKSHGASLFASSYDCLVRHGILSKSEPNWPGTSVVFDTVMKCLDEVARFITPASRWRRLRGK